MWSLKTSYEQLLKFSKRKILRDFKEADHWRTRYNHELDRIYQYSAEHVM